MRRRCSTWGCTNPCQPGRRRCAACLERQRERGRERYERDPEPHRARTLAAYHRRTQDQPKQHKVHCRRCGGEGHFAKTCTQERRPA